MKTIEIKREEITQQLREYILRRDNYTCRYCGSRKDPLHLDHVYPVSKGGETSEENLVTSCLRCNVKKHAKVGIFPKPVGYFDENKKSETSILSIVILSLGLALVSNGFINMLDYFEFSRISTFSGILVLFISLGRFATGK